MNAPAHLVAIWDMDGTIFDTERLHLESWEEHCDEHGLENARETIMQCVGRNVVDTNAILRKTYGEDFDVHHHRDLKNQKFEKKILEGIPVKSGVVEALDWLERASVPMALASSSSRDTILSHLEHGNLSRYFRSIVGGDQVKRGKPDPEIFLMAAAELGVEPSKCVVFEDSQNGVIAGHEAGMTVVMIPDLLQPAHEIRHRVHHLIASLKGSEKLLETLFR